MRGRACGRVCGLWGWGAPGWASHPAAIAAGLLGVPVGGGPSARRPRRELRSARRLEARPGPAAAHRHRSLALRQPPHWRWWGFLYEAFWWRVADVSDPRVAKFPRLVVVVRSRFVVVWCSKCRPPRRKMLKMGCCGRGGLRFGHNGVWQGVLFAREPDVASGNPLRRIQTRYSERGRDCPRTH